MTNRLHSRAHIMLKTQADAISFVQKLSGCEDEFTIENRAARYRANAKSVIGVIYAMYEFGGEMYLVNNTHDGFIPGFIDSYRVMNHEERAS